MHHDDAQLARTQEFLVMTVPVELTGGKVDADTRAVQVETGQHVVGRQPARAFMRIHRAVDEIEHALARYRLDAVALDQAQRELHARILRRRLQAQGGAPCRFTGKVAMTLAHPGGHVTENVEVVVDPAALTEQVGDGRIDSLAGENALCRQRAELAEVFDDLRTHGAVQLDGGFHDSPCDMLSSPV
jgi:hypothetical protein